jgi:hypothetical protein
MVTLVTHCDFTAGHTLGRAPGVVHIYIHTYIHTYIPFHVISPGKPLAFGYEMCPQDLADTIRLAQINAYTYKINNLKYTSIHNFMNYIVLI